jgi:predicted Zn finger-like uncharacterized protein
MLISTTCPSCKALFRLPDELAGRKVKCQKCASMFLVPTAEMDGTVAGVLVPVEAAPVVEKVEPTITPAVIALPPMPVDTPSAPPPQKAEEEDNGRYSDDRGKPPPAKKRSSDSERSRPARTEKPKAGSIAVILGVIGLVALALITCIGATGIWYVVASDSKKPVVKRKVDGVKEKDVIRKDDFAKKDEIAKEIFVKDGMKKDGFPKDGIGKGFFKEPPPAPPPPGPAGSLSVIFGPDYSYRNDNVLTIFDPINPVQQGRQKVYMVRFEQGQTYQIDMVSNQMDSFLFIIDDTNAVVASDDDSGGNLNALIQFTPFKSGVYKIEATTFGPNMVGNYSLTVRRIR